MSEYTAPLRDLQFAMRELAGLEEIQSLPGYEEATTDLVDAVLEEANKFAAGVLSPLNPVGDRIGAQWKDGVVTTAPGWQEAYRQFTEAGWTSLACEPEHGGQGLPKLLSTAVIEMWKSANVAFALCPMLTNGAIEAISLRGNDEQKAQFLPRMISGEWTGTMGLTEPNAGSDLAAVSTRAEPNGDGSYRIFGQKIFITYGEHDLTSNIIHLVLARLPDAPEGVKGISLFVVPKFLLDREGNAGERNDVHCVSIEHKLGIHGSPTCVLAFGDKGGAIGTLVGEPGKGLEIMFIMMNEARFAVGMEGLALSERAYQHALAYARERIQGTEAGVRGGPKVPIIRHPDVRRMLLSMRSQTEAMRAIAHVTSAASDSASRHGDASVRQQQQAFSELMTPIVKGWFTENSIEITSTGIQVHGGVGFIEETGAAQYFRDSRITPIYEGTTAIQAIDLVGRKIARENGATIKLVIVQMRQVQQQLASSSQDALKEMGQSLAAAIIALEQAVDYITANYGDDIKAVLAGAVPFLKLFGIVSGGWQMARAALIAQQHLDAGTSEQGFYSAKLASAYFYVSHVLVQAAGLSLVVTKGAGATQALDEDLF